VFGSQTKGTVIPQDAIDGIHKATGFKYAGAHNL
jgi:hypothetical protein